MIRTPTNARPLIPAVILAIALIPSVIGVIPLSTSPVASIQYRDGRVEFSYPLRLTDSYSTRNLAGESHPTYYLTIDFPVAAVEPLDRLVISLTEGHDPTFSYRPEATTAFVNTSEGRQPLSLGEVKEDPASQTLTLQFNPPLPPGQTITVALAPHRNPRYAGVYLFGVQAYPIGENPQPSFIGYARLSFYERDSHRLWP
jgi:hypothetical protein